MKQDVPSEDAGSGFPVSIDAAAIPHLKRILARDGRQGAFVRVGVKGGGCSGLEYVLKLDVEHRPGDLTKAFEGVSVACDPKSAKLLSGAKLLWTGNLVTGGFAFENPNAARSCGCGTSFTPK